MTLVRVALLLLLAAPAAPEARAPDVRSAVHQALVDSATAPAPGDVVFLAEDTAAFAEYLALPGNASFVRGLAESCVRPGVEESLTALVAAKPEAVVAEVRGRRVTRLGVLAAFPKPPELPRPATRKEKRVFIALSEVGVSADGSTAAACVASSRGVLNGGGTCHVLAKQEDGAWKSVCKQSLWHW